MSTINNDFFELSFDIGYSSIGWSIFSKLNNAIFPNIMGCGVVIFDEQSCMTKQRSTFRRMRKNIAATRNRISRLREVFSNLGVMSSEELDNSKTVYPWILAAQVLSSDKKLSWPELWAVIRYYAHNRGYDGNREWCSSESSADDIEKEANARRLMEHYGTSTQAETICAYLDVDLKSGKNPSLRKYFKGENVAFPRDVVFAEVERIIDAHIGVLPKCDAIFKNIIIGNWREAKSTIVLPKRFTSNNGLLFGQFVPRFDNRIISKCPISGKKVPVCHSREFLKFRWKMLLSNIAFPSGIDPVWARSEIDSQMRSYGKLSKTTFKKILEKVLGELPSNYDSMFLTEEMESALLLDPVRAEILKTVYPNIAYSLPPQEKVNEFWNMIPKFVFTQMFRFKAFSISEICALLGKIDAENLRKLAEEIYNLSPISKKTMKANFDEVFLDKICIKKLKGRAAYARDVMVRACSEIDECKDPRAVGGALYRDTESNRAELLSNIDSWTNNHLVRHRLKMFKRLFLDIVSHYCEGDLSKIKSVSIEVIKDLTAFSGLNIKEKAAKLNAMVAHHKSVSQYLQQEYPELELSGSILRKARIADDLAWTCPYTGVQFSPRQLFEDGNMELEHIIPRSLRPSDSLDSLVVTWKEVNDMKGQRTAMEFIEECQGMQVAGRPNLTITTPARFEAFVKRLAGPQHRGGAPDRERIKRRKILLLTKHYNKREGTFLPSDLTQTSHLNKLAFKIIKSIYVDKGNCPELVHIPGSVTSAMRKNWNLLPCIGKTCPEIFETSATGDMRLRSKDEIRSITHLHHATDAIAMGIASSIFPHTKRFYELISKRRLNNAEKDELRKTGLFEFSEKGWQLVELTPDYLAAISDSLAEGRVVKHLPKKMSGLDVEQTLWGVVSENENGSISIRQYKANKDGDLRRERKLVQEKKTKLLGYAPENISKSKLARKKAVIVIKGNYGVALSNPPIVIPYHNVWKRLQEIAKSNGGKIPQVLRRNQTIQIEEGKYKGIWRITSVKSDATLGIVLDMISPVYIKLKSKVSYAKRNITLSNIMAGKFKIICNNLVGS